jgi:hypothetical protein
MNAPLFWNLIFQPRSFLSFPCGIFLAQRYAVMGQPRPLFICPPSLVDSRTAVLRYVCVFSFRTPIPLCSPPLAVVLLSVSSVFERPSPFDLHLSHGNLNPSLLYEPETQSRLPSRRHSTCIH